MSFKAKPVKDSSHVVYKYTPEETYNRERPDDGPKWGQAEAGNEGRRPGKGKDMAKPSTVCNP